MGVFFVFRPRRRGRKLYGGYATGTGCLTLVLVGAVLALAALAFAIR